MLYLLYVYSLRFLFCLQNSALRKDGVIIRQYRYTSALPQQAVIDTSCLRLRIWYWKQHTHFNVWNSHTIPGSEFYITVYFYFLHIEFNVSLLWTSFLEWPLVNVSKHPCVESIMRHVFLSKYCFENESIIFPCSYSKYTSPTPKVLEFGNNKNLIRFWEWFHWEILWAGTRGFTISQKHLMIGRMTFWNCPRIWVNCMEF